MRQLSANLLLRRSHFNERFSTVVDNQQQLIHELDIFIQGEDSTNSFSNTIEKRIGPGLNAFGLSQVAVWESSLWDRNTLVELADLYVQGFDQFSETCFSMEERAPLLLPTYPFDRRDCSIKVLQDSDELNNGYKNHHSLTAHANPQIDKRHYSESDHSIIHIVSMLNQLMVSITGYESHEIDSNTVMSEYGLDSMMSMRLLAEVNQAFDITLQLIDLSDNNTSAKLAQLIYLKTTQRKAVEFIVNKNHAINLSNDVSLPKAIATLPKYIEYYILPEKQKVEQISLFDWAHSALTSLLKQGVALFYDGQYCCLLAHQSINIANLLDSLSDDEQLFIQHNLPVNQLISPASQEQMRSLYHSEIMGQAAWNIQHLYKTKHADINRVLFSQATQYVVSKHDLLRSRFYPSSDIWIQCVEPISESDNKSYVEFINFDTLSEFEEFISKQRIQQLSVDTLPIIKIWVSQIAGNSYVGFVSHHCLADAFSTSLLFVELMDYYNNLAQGKQLADNPVKEQYWHYALQQFDDDVYAKKSTRQYWERLLANNSGQSVKLPYIHQEKLSGKEQLTQDAQQSSVHLLTISDELMLKINRFNKTTGTSTVDLFTTALGIILTHLCGNTNIFIQLMNSQRDRLPLMDMVGDFTNPLLMPLSLSAKQRAVDAIKQVTADNLQHLKHAKIRFNEWLKIAGFEDYCHYHTNINNIMINAADVDSATLNTLNEYGSSLYADLVLQTVTNLKTTVPSVATLFYQILTIDSRLHIVTAYRSQLFERTVIDTMSSMLVQIIENIMTFPEKTIGQVIERFDLLDTSIGEKNKRFVLPISKSQMIFEECQLLNKIQTGCPIFWFHGGLGGVESYRDIALTCERPFYGIQAKGWMSEEEPIVGIAAMASHYINIIQTIQPQGPYDLGGFSLGGMIAYEVTRQLQEAGQSVNSIMMIDTLDSDELEKVSPESTKTLMLQAANLFLLSTVALNMEKMSELGISYNELDFTLSDDRFLDRLVVLAKEKGLKLSQVKLKALIDKVVSVQLAYSLNDYVMQSLPRPDAVDCHYIDNKNGLFLGDLQSYFSGPNDNIVKQLDDSWKTWQQKMPNFYLTQVDAPSHMSMLLDPMVNSVIISFCNKLYNDMVEEVSIDD